MERNLSAERTHIVDAIARQFIGNHEALRVVDDPLFIAVQVSPDATLRETAAAMRRFDDWLGAGAERA